MYNYDGGTCTSTKTYTVKTTIAESKVTGYCKGVDRNQRVCKPNECWQGKVLELFNMCEFMLLLQLHMSKVESSGCFLKHVKMELVCGVVCIFAA